MTLQLGKDLTRTHFKSAGSIQVTPLQDGHNPSVVGAELVSALLMECNESVLK